MLRIKVMNGDTSINLLVISDRNDSLTLVKSNQVSFVLRSSDR